MTIILAFFGIITILPILIIGILYIRSKGEKGDFLLAGWNTMSEAKRAKYNKRALFTFMGWFFIGLSALTALVFLVTIFQWRVLTAVGWGVWTIYVAVGLIYSNISKKFRNNKEE
ncbi:MAG: DUF3784 domain-containing protein [Defluviitaleaceae bacterium]|nr:DUF3784 domain-containing protein [Defluviitaleaceae bacterium]